MNDPKKSSKIRRVVNSNRTDFSLHSKSRETTRNRLFTRRGKNGLQRPAGVGKSFYRCFSSVFSSERSQLKLTDLEHFFQNISLVVCVQPGSIALSKFSMKKKLFFCQVIKLITETCHYLFIKNATSSE